VAARTGTLDGLDYVMSRDGMLPCGQRRQAATAEITIFDDATFQAVLPYRAPQQVDSPIPVEGVAVPSGRTAKLTFDAESIDAIGSTIGVDKCSASNIDRLVGVSVTVKRAVLVTNKRATKAKIGIDLSVVTTYQQPKRIVQVSYTLKAAGAWFATP